MLNLQKRINGVDSDREYLEKRIAIRDQLLTQGNFSSYVVFSVFPILLIY